jgi:two-component system chemotaxis sensor kinase CheA
MDTAKYRRLFLDGAQEQMEILDRSLALLSRGEGEAAMPELRRAWHSLKGMSATMGHEELAAVAHAVEEQLRPSPPSEITPHLLAAVTDAADGVGRFLTALADDTPPPDLSTVIARLRAGDASPAAIGDGAADPGPAGGKEPIPGLPPSLRVATRELDGLLAEATDLETVLAALQRGEDGATGRDLSTPAAVDADLVLDRLRRGVQRLRRRIGRIRLVPFSMVGPALHRVVADGARRLGKRVVLEIEGEEIRLDRGTLEALLNPLCHLLRNAVDHGFEPATSRTGKGAGEPGRVRLALQLRGERLHVCVEDDGRGVDLHRLAAALGPDAPSPEDLARPGADLSRYLCRPGLSTARTTSEISGRGIGLDAVQQNLGRCGGRLAITSRPGAGTRVEIVVPQQVSVISCLLARAGSTTFGIPFSAVAGVDARTARDLRDAVPLERLLGAQAAPGSESRGILLRLAVPGRSPRRPVLVDALTGRLDAVVRPLLGAHRDSAYAGTALCADGTPVAIIDAARLKKPPAQVIDLREDRPPPRKPGERAP